MQADMMLCDFAESINGKLYIMGGGFGQVRGSAPLSCSVAIRLAVPWEQAEIKHQLRLELIDQKGTPVTDPHGEPVRVEGEFELARPPDLMPGSEMTNTLAIRIQGLPLSDNQYRFTLSVDGEQVASTSFAVIRPAEWRPPTDG